MDIVTTPKEDIIMTLIKFIQESDPLLKEQSPVIITEMLEVGFYTHLSSMVGCILLSIIYMASVYYWNYSEKCSKIGKSDLKVIVDSILIVLGGAMFIWMYGSAFHFHEILEICISPRLYLLEKLSGML